MTHINTSHVSPAGNIVLFLGFGYVAHYLADLLNHHQWGYFSLSSREKQFNFDLKPSYSNLKNPVLSFDLLAQVTHIIVTAPPTKDQDSVLNTYSELILKILPNLKWLGYISSTSVYGNHDGDVVTEISDCHPTSEHGKNRFLVENLWQSFAKNNQIPLHIFRLAGIYGTDRNTINDVRFSQTVNIIKQGHLMNRMYVKDIARALLCSMDNPTPHHIFNLADDMPSSTAAMNDYIAFLLDKPQLIKMPYEDCLDKISDMRKSFYQESKIISNDKIKKVLNFELQYPTYRDGINDILAVELLHRTDKIH
jgi:nucleoside-diphosphate-sugar epimerase